MRYARFKKQMDGTAAVRRPRNPNTPRKSKVEKNKSPRKIKEQNTSDNAENIKAEPWEGKGSRQGSVEGTPEVGIGMGIERMVKSEPGLAASRSDSNTGTPFPSTPTHGSKHYAHSGSERDESESPGQCFGEGMSDMEDMLATSFGMVGGEGMYAPMMGDGHVGGMGQHGHGFGIGMPMGIGLGDPYEGLWGPGLQQEVRGGPAGMHGNEGGVLVKTEPRWEEAYRQI